MRSVLWVAVVMLVAGCADEAPAEPGESAEERQARQGDALELAGALPDPIEISWDGALNPAVCAPSGLNSCMWTQAPLFDKDDSLFLEASPAAWSGSLTLTWDHATPDLDRLRLSVGFYKKCGATCWEGTGDSASEIGTSPFVLDVRSLMPSPDSEGLWVSVQDLPLIDDPAYVFANAGHEFRVEGRLTPMAPDPDEA